MKNIILACALLLSATFANAQNPGPGDRNGASDNSATSTPRATNEFDHTQMTVEHGVVTFSGLPEVKNSAFVVVTNAAGDVIKQNRISPEKNSLKLGSLPPDLYFVTIIHDNKSRKAFTLKV
jgi:hypothetical protein